MTKDEASASDVGSSCPGPESAQQGNPGGGTSSIRRLALRGSAWTFAGYGASQALRLGGNLLLARLLVPGMFGVMSLVAVVMYGLQMFSDIGAGPAIVRDERGDDPVFLNTAWTIQVGRGFMLWLCACMLSIPAAAFYSEPQLTRLIPVAGLSAIISGFNSTSIHLARRHIRLGRLNLIELAAQTASLVTMLSWALLIERSVWALVAGGLASSTTRLILGHLVLPGPRNWFTWEREAAHALFTFGRWIFLSSALFFLAKQGDRLLLARYVDMTSLGVYAIALNLCDPFIILNQRLVRQVMLPVFSRVFRDQQGRVSGMFYKSRLVLDGFFITSLGVLATSGTLVVEILYPENYAAAGWMLQILSLRAALACLGEPSANCAVAIGHPSYVTATHVARTGWILLGIPLGWHLGGIRGVVWAASLSEAPVIPILWWGLARQGVLSLTKEMRSFLFFLGGVGIGVAAVRIMRILFDGWLL